MEPFDSWKKYDTELHGTTFLVNLFLGRELTLVVFFLEFCMCFIKCWPCFETSDVLL